MNVRVGVLMASLAVLIVLTAGCGADAESAAETPDSQDTRTFFRGFGSGLDTAADGETTAADAGTAAADSSTTQAKDGADVNGTVTADSSGHVSQTDAGQGQVNDAGVDIVSASLPTCGNGVCAGLEVIPDCAIDCDPTAKQVWTCAAKQCAAQRNACILGSGCLGKWQTTMLCLKVCDFKAACVSKCSKELAGSTAAQALGSCALPGCMTSGGGSCGDGICQATENTQSCATDCQATSTCGDETCANGENTTTCPLDCEADAAKVWGCMQSNCSSEKTSCQADTGCLKVLNDAAICLKNCAGDKSCEQGCQGPVVSDSTALALGICALQKCKN